MLVTKIIIFFKMILVRSMEMVKEQPVGNTVTDNVDIA